LSAVSEGAAPTLKAVSSGPEQARDVLFSLQRPPGAAQTVGEAAVRENFINHQFMKTLCMFPGSGPSRRTAARSALRNALSTLIVLLGFQLPAWSQQYSPPPNGLVAWWRADGNGNDSAGTNNGFVANNVTFVPGLFGQAFNCPGLYPGLVSIPDNDNFRLTNSLTLSVWVNMQHNSWIVAGRANNYQIGFDFAGHSRFCINGGGGDLVLLPTNFIPFNQWTHLAETLDGSTGDMRAYINGILVAETNTSVRPAYSISPSWVYGFGIGAADDSSASFSFNGYIDEVLLYSRALSPSEIMTLASTNGACEPHAATATATVVNGFVVGINLTDGGCGYTNPPLVQIVGGGGSNATAVATVANGIVNGISVMNAGFGYTNTPQVLIASPPFLPWLNITTSQVRVTAHVMIGQTYVLQSSTDLVNWTNVGPPFTAQAEVITQVFDVDSVGRFFRLLQLP
jgi:hypothetical protein